MSEPVAVPTDPTPAARVEDALFDACTAAFSLTAPLAAWHAAGRPALFDGHEPELAAAVHALADRLVAEGPIHAARSLGTALPPDVWLLIDEEDPDDDQRAACTAPQTEDCDGDGEDPAIYYGRVA